MDVRDIRQQLLAQGRKIAAGDLEHVNCQDVELIEDATGMTVMCGCGLVLIDSNKLEPSEPPRQPPSELLPPTSVTPMDPIAVQANLLDPTRVLTPDEVNQRMVETINRIERGALYEREIILRLETAQYEYDMAIARAMDTAEGAADQRKARALLAVEDLAQRLHVAKLARTAVKETMHNLRSILSGYQSVGRSVGAVYNAGGSPHGRPF